MIYRLELAKKAQKDIQKLDDNVKIRIYKCFSILSHNPFAGKKLKGNLKNQFSIRVWPYRIIYEIYHSALLILIIRVGHRQGIYR